MRVCFSTALVSYTSFRFGWLLFDAMPPFFSRFVCKMGVPQKLLSATRPSFLIAHLLHPIATLFSLPPHLLQRFRSSAIHSASPLPVSFASPSFPVLWAPSLHLFHPNIFLALPARQLLHLSRFPLFPGALGSAFPWLLRAGGFSPWRSYARLWGIKK